MQIQPRICILNVYAIEFTLHTEKHSFLSLKNLPSLIRGNLIIKQLCLVIFRMNLPLIRRNIKHLFKIPVKCGHRLKSAPFRHQFHAVRVFLHIFTGHLHPHQIQVIGRRHIHNLLEHSAEMRLRHVALPRQIPDCQLLRIVRANIMQGKGTPPGSAS